MSYFGDSDKIDVSSLANARARHANDMSLINPQFEILQESIPVIVGENAMMLSIFGNPPDNPVVTRDWFEFFFRREQFPVSLGWTPPSAAIGPSVGTVVEAIIAQSPPDVPLTFTPKSA
ncbi:hypothetical protein N0V87_004775 [Didymella glomerata]|uniref:Heme haloperoxidase family profile domain-containing protein n=1 Tax=Didymella glomerata TaxID=749621 RepID=A0A9W9C0A0_9PLEO|nr:hypothetical protein N0V87_004775 [Didymella glomerata]